MSLEIIWLPRASAALDHQLDYIADRNPSAALKVGAAVIGSIDRLREFPFLGRSGRAQGTRELVVSGTPYVVIYRVRSNSVLILRLLHGAQRWPPG